MEIVQTEQDILTDLRQRGLAARLPIPRLTWDMLEQAVQTGRKDLLPLERIRVAVEQWMVLQAQVQHNHIAMMIDIGTTFLADYHIVPVLLDNAVLSKPSAVSQISPAIEDLLLSAPPGRRLDLAIATLLYQVQQDHVLIIENGQRAVEPIWHFTSDFRYPYVYTAKPLALFSQHAPAALKLVPAYSQEHVFYEEVVRWVAEMGRGKLRVSIEQSGAFQQVTVQHLARDPDDRQPVLTRQDKTAQSDWLPLLYRLTCLVVLDAYAPELLPLLVATQAPVARWSSFLDYPPITHAQTLILLPRWIPYHTLIFACMHEEYDAETRAWVRCSTLLDEDSDECVPEPCPGCGGYYCSHHLSQVGYWFDCTAQEQRDSQQISQRRKLSVCRACALLPEADVRQLRAVRLAWQREK